MLNTPRHVSHYLKGHEVKDISRVKINLSIGLVKASSRHFCTIYNPLRGCSLFGSCTSFVKRSSEAPSNQIKPSNHHIKGNGFGYLILLSPITI